MPQHKSNFKRMRTNKKSTTRNKTLKTKIHSNVRKVLETKERPAAEAALKDAFSAIDKSVKAGIVHKNTAANKKSRLQLIINKIAK